MSYDSFLDKSNKFNPKDLILEDYNDTYDNNFLELLPNNNKKDKKNNNQL